MRILFDKNVPYPLLGYLAKHNVRTAEELGWARLVNGDLLRAAEDAGFGVMVTADQSLEYQQNLKGRKLALVVLSTNHTGVLKKLACSKSILKNSWRRSMRHGKAAMSLSGSICRQNASIARPEPS